MFLNALDCFGQPNFSSGSEAKKSCYKLDVRNLLRLRILEWSQGQVMWGDGESTSATSRQIERLLVSSGFLKYWQDQYATQRKQ